MKNFFRSLKSSIRSLVAVINTPPVRRVSPHCANINMLLMHLCDFNSDHYSYILQWLAYPLKNPGAKMCYGLVINGDHATDKNLFFKQVALPLHAGSARFIHADALRNRFTNWVGAPLVAIDGPMAQRSMERIKSLMTSTLVNIQSKTKPPRTVPNQMNFVFLSVHADYLHTDVGDRRFMVVEAPPARNRVFYQAIEYEIRNGGVDAFREYLMHGIDLTGFNESTMPPGLNRSGSNGAKPLSIHAERAAA